MTDISNPIYHDENKARTYLESVRWPDGPVCPFCDSGEHVKALKGKSMGAGWYHCTDCRKKFTVRLGTLYERSHVPLHKWLLATRLLTSSKKGMSAHQLHRTLGVTYKTAWFMAHRIREAMRDNDTSPLGGEGQTVEADETYVGKRKPRANDYKFVSGQGWFARSHYDMKEPVISLVERDGRVRSFHVDSVTAKNVRQKLVENVDRKSHLMTDQATFYKKIGREFKSHEMVNHSIDEYVRGEAGTQVIENYFSIFKRGLTGVYQHVGAQHLKRYICEFDFRYNTRKINDKERADIALKGIEGKRLMYRRPHKAANA